MPATSVSHFGQGRGAGAGHFRAGAGAGHFGQVTNAPGRRSRLRTLSGDVPGARELPCPLAAAHLRVPGWLRRN
ncbi:MAG: hypothetical protein GY719_40960 [bacterium]|nr:hypothetical protein [bacterium]